jgi:hypothetical protein
VIEETLKANSWRLIAERGLFPSFPSSAISRIIHARPNRVT